MTIVIAGVPVFGAATAVFAQAEKGVGKGYGTRDPSTCLDTKQPLRGAISADQAKQYVICGMEHVQSSYLYLVENVSVEVGKGRPFRPLSEPFGSDIDQKFPVYPIRSAFKQYQCGHQYIDPASPLYNVGKNCTISNELKAEGKCVKTTFGDWRCDITSRSADYTSDKPNMPPPTSSDQASKMPVNADQNIPKAAAGNSVPSSKPATNQDQDTLVYPKPDTTEMEKWYDVGRNEYDSIAGKLYFVVKPKKDSRPSAWMINFYDSDGVQVIPENGLTGTSIFTPIGQAEKIFAYTPSEKNMKRVKKIVVTRVVN